MRKFIIIFICLIACLFMASQAMAYQPFPDTGQTMCYDAGYNALSCDTIQPRDPYYGQDVHYQPRLPRSYTKLGMNDVELPDNEPNKYDGGDWIMTRDNVTGLIWELKTNANRSDPHDWSNAQSQFIAGLNSAKFGGFENWRLPTREELSSLVNRGFVNPAIDKDFFPNTVSAAYWSSTTYAPGTSLAWRVYFSYGNVSSNLKSNSYYVRAVRSGPPPQPSLVDNGDGTVTDTATGLMWQKCSYGQTWEAGQCTGSAAAMNWQQALEYAEGLNLGGYSDWRLPNINELQTLVDDTTYSPAIDKDFFPNTVSAAYWSSTTYAYLTYRAWRVDFGYGYVLNDYKSSSYYVRAVRSGQSDIQKHATVLPGVLMLLLDDEVKPLPPPQPIID